MAAVDRSRGRVYRASTYIPPAVEAGRRFKTLANALVYVGGGVLIAVLLSPEIRAFLGWWSS